MLNDVDRQWPVTSNRALGKVRRPVPEGLTGGQPDGANNVVHRLHRSHDFVCPLTRSYLSGYTNTSLRDAMKV